MFDASECVGSASESGDRLPSKTRTRSPASVLNSLVWRRGFEATESIPYGVGPRRTLDIYRPNASTAAPVVVFFYGGNWQSGDKEMYLFLAAALARRGYVTVVPDYRVYPEARYPGFLEDGALAVRWARIDRRWLRAVDLSPGRDIAGFIGIAGPYDFLPLKDETLKVIFGGANVPATQPVSYVSGGEPPTLLATGDDDGTVDPGNATRLASRLRAAGCDVRVATYARVGHLGIIGAFAFPLRLLAPILNDVDAFIAKSASKQASRATQDVGLVS